LCIAYAIPAAIEYLLAIPAIKNFLFSRSI
jgi:hypothetical protein